MWGLRGQNYIGMFSWWQCYTGSVKRNSKPTNRTKPEESPAANSHKAKKNIQHQNLCLRMVNSKTTGGGGWGACWPILPIPNIHPRFKCCTNRKWLFGSHRGCLLQSVNNFAFGICPCIVCILCWFVSHILFLNELLWEDCGLWLCLPRMHIRFSRESSHVNDFSNRNKLSSANLLIQRLSVS